MLVLAAGGLCVALGRLGGDAVDAARARTAADAAALAGAAAGQGAGRGVASANGGELEVFVEDGAGVLVTVRVGRAVATARAVGSTEGAVGATRAGLVPALAAALARAGEVLGEAVPISSGWRSAAQQEALWAGRGSNPFPVARPGTSAHERGEAVDVPRQFAERLAEIGPAVGLCRPLPRTDPVHFQLCRPRQ
jgi:hypothetical protein